MHDGPASGNRLLFQMPQSRSIGIHPSIGFQRRQRFTAQTLNHFLVVPTRKPTAKQHAARPKPPGVDLLQQAPEVIVFPFAVGRLVVQPIVAGQMSISIGSTATSARRCPSQFVCVCPTRRNAPTPFFGSTACPTQCRPEPKIRRPGALAAELLATALRLPVP